MWRPNKCTLWQQLTDGSCVGQVRIVQENGVPIIGVFPQESIREVQASSDQCTAVALIV